MALFGVEVNRAHERSLVLRFGQFPDFARDRLIAAMWRIERRLEAAVHAAQPSRTGALRAQTGGRVYEHPNRIAAVVGVRVPNADDAMKAAALEYGSSRVVQVRAHAAKLNHIWGRIVAPITVQRPGHTRRTNLRPDRYLRDPYAAIKADALGEMRVAIEDAAQVVQR